MAYALAAKPPRFALSLLTALAFLMSAPLFATSTPQTEVPPSQAEPSPQPPTDDALSIGWGAIPAINFNSDDGLGYGALGSVFWYDGTTKPYRAALTAQAFLTTNWIHAHYVRLDALNVNNWPIRAFAEVGYYSSITQNYCGMGVLVACDTPENDPALNTSGDTPVSRYNKLRFRNMYTLLAARYRFRDKPHRFELFAAYRGAYWMPGTWEDPTPYQGSRFASERPDGDAGFASTFQFGAVVDDRDHEPAPKKGYVLELSARASSDLWGSDWSYLGANLTALGFVPLNKQKNAILASRTVADVVVDGIGRVFGGKDRPAPIYELVRPGGTRDYISFGGEWIGRGIRVQRFVGRVKGFQQFELRYTFATHTLFGADVEWTGLGFTDLGWVAPSIEDVFTQDPFIATSFGGGLRLTLNKNFILRADVGTSPLERWAPAFYININHVL